MYKNVQDLKINKVWDIVDRKCEKSNRKIVVTFTAEILYRYSKLFKAKTSKIGEETAKGINSWTQTLNKTKFSCF